MAKQYAKRVAASNSQSLSQLKIGFLISNLIHILHFFIFKSTRTSSRIALFTLTETIALVLWRLLVASGTPSYDQYGNIVKSGDDLSQEGFTAYMFDIIYIVWAVHIFTALISVKFWFLLIIIPIFATYKIWTAIIQPYVLPRFFGSGDFKDSADVDDADNDGLSKRQRKMQKRQTNTKVVRR